MKFLIIFIFAIVGSTLADESVEFGIADQVRDAIENVKKQMPCGFPEYGIPPLAPFEHEFEHVELEHEVVSILGNISKVFAIGADNFDIRQCSFSIWSRTLTLELNLNEFHVQKGNYILDALVFAGNKDLTIFGDGAVDFAIRDANLKVTAKFGIIGGIKLKEFHAVLALGDVSSKITGLMGGDIQNEIINGVIEELMLTSVVDFQPQISATIKEIAVPLIEKFLQEMKFAEFLDSAMTGGHYYKSTCQKSSILY